MSRYSFPPYIFAIIGGVVGMVIGLLTGDYAKWVGIGTIIGGAITGILYMVVKD